jgi:hypothetical protein
MLEASCQYGIALLKQELRFFILIQFRHLCQRNVRENLVHKTNNLFRVLDDLYKEKIRKEQEIRIREMENQRQESNREEVDAIQDGDT